MRNAAFIRKCGIVILLLVGIALCFAWTVERTSFADSSNKKVAGPQTFRTEGDAPGGSEASPERSSDDRRPGRVSGGVPEAPLAPDVARTYTPNTFLDPAVSGGSITVRTTDGHIMNGAVDTGVVSLRSAIIAANNNVNVNPEFDTITLGNGTYTLTIPAGTAAEPAQPGLPNIGDVDVTTTGLVINGNGPANTAIQQTSGIDRVIDVNPPFLVGNFFFTLNGVTITGGRSTSGDAGGLYSGSNDTGLMTKGKITINNCVFKNNIVTNPGFGGGGMQNFGGDLDIINTTFGGVGVTDPNRSDKAGGGLAAVGATNAHTITITGSTFTNNVSVDSGSGGGGLDLASNGAQSAGTTATVTNCTFTGNQAQTTGSGGGIIVESILTTVTNSTFANNSAANRGGGIYVGGGSLHLNSSSGSINFTGNTAAIAAATSISTASSVTVSGTNVSIGGSIEVTTNGSWTNNAGSTLSPTNVQVVGGTFTMNNSTMNVGGNLTIGPGPVVGSTFNGNTGTVNIQGNLVLTAGGAPATTLNAGTGTFNFNGTGSQSITNGTLITFFNLTDSNTTQPLTLNNSFNVNGTLNVNGANAVLAPVAASIIGGTGTLTGNGTARVTRIAATAGFLNQYTITNKTLTNLLVDYVGVSPQVLSAFTYGPLRINNAGGVASAAGTATVNGLLTLQSGALNVGTSTLVINNGTSVGAGSLTSSATGTVNYNQASGGQAVIAGTYGNLTFSNFSKVLASAGTIGIAGTFTPGSAVGHTVTGSTINFNGTGAQTVPAFQYNNLTISGARGVNNVTLANGGIVAILGVFNPTATFAGGSYVVTNNTVDFNGTGSQTIPAFNYNNLTSSSTGARTLANGGSIGVAGTFAPGTNVYTITGSTINFNGAGPQTIPAFNYNNLTSSNGAAARTLAGAGVIGIAGVFTPGANVYTILGSTIDFNGGVAQTIPAFNYNHLTSSNSGARTLANAGTIGVFGIFTPGSNVYTITGSTINFNGTGSQNIPAFGYNNLTSSSTGARTLANTGIIGVAGAFTPGTNGYTTIGSTITYNGAAQSVAVFPYNNLSTAGSGIKSLTGATTVGGALTIGVGTTLDVTAGNFALNVAGNWTNNGAFTQRSGTVTLNGLSQQTIGGTSATTFNNLIVNNPSGVLASLNVTVNGLLTLTAGTFNIGTNTLTLNNGTSVGAGALNGASGTTSYNQASPGQVVLAGNYNNLTFSNFDKSLPNGGTIGISGVFTPGTAVGHTITNSTIDFNGSGAQTIPAFNYFHLTSSNSGARTLASSGTIGIAGIFTPGTNAYTIAGSTINFNGSGPQTIPAFNYNNLTSSNTGARTLASSGIVGIAGIFTPGTNVYTIADSTVEYNGSLLQTLPAGFPTYNNLRINNPAGANLAGNTTVNGVLTLISGEINTGAFTLTIGPSGSVTRTSGHVVGTVNKLFSGPGPQFVFPVGTAGRYSPVDVTVMSGSGSLSIKANAGTAPATPPLDSTRMLQRYWSLNGTGITSNVVFHYIGGAPPAGDIPTTSTESAYHIFRILGTGQAIRTPPDGIGIFLDTVNDTFTVVGMNQYSDWTAGEPLAPTAANVNVSGRVVDANGRGVSSAHVMMQDQTGDVLWATTNPFGYYRFAGVPAGQTYLFSPRHKRYEFQPRAVTINEDLTGLDFIAKP